MKIKKIKLKKEQKKTAIIAIATIVFFAAIYGLYEYKADKYSIKTPTSVAARVTFADGSTQTFDSNTMVPGAIYNPATGQVISGVYMTLKVNPVVELSGASAISYPSSLPTGYVIKSNEPSATISVSLIGSGLSMGGFKVYTKPSVQLMPNTANIFADEFISASDLDSATSSLANNAQFDVAWQQPGLLGIYTTLYKPDGTQQTAYVNAPAPTIKITLQKQTPTTGTATYTLKSVTLS